MTKLLNFLILILLGCCLFWANAQDFKAACLKAHNRFRKMHGVPDLVLDDTLQQFSLQWAQYLARTGKAQHRENLKYGENIYYAGFTGVTGYNATKLWYDEIKDYDWNNPVFAANTGHFTQVVWKSSKKMGCGFAKNGTRTVVVANYDPPGNYEGQFTANVPKKIN